MAAAGVTSGAELGLIGLGVMGRSLALNLADHGVSVALWNRETDWVDAFIAERRDAPFVATRSLEELVASLTRPRRVLLMITAGPAVDEVFERLAPLLAPGDTLLDGGNSAFQDTVRREAALRSRGLHYLGVGVSGGEEGARRGPSLMVGGPRAGWEAVKAPLEAIAARSSHGPCVGHVGPDGAGHLVKTAHNAIEYGAMQVIAEAYDLLRRGLGLDVERVAATFARWNEGRTGSFLLDLTARILRARDLPSGRPLLDLVVDRAAQKGTGAWALELALRLGVPMPTVSAAVDARLVSAASAARRAAIEAFAWSAPPPGPDPTAPVDDAEAAVHSAMVCAYSQGLDLVRAASTASSWEVDLAEVARLWTGGAIVQASLLEPAIVALRRQPAPPSLLVAEPFRTWLQTDQPAWRRTVQLAQARGIPVPALSASLAYFDAFRAERLPQALVQAQRDAFGAHRHERVDHPEWGLVHSEWSTR